MARFVGIDLGHRSARAAVFDGSFGRLQLVGYHEVDVAQDLDAPPDRTTVLAAAAELCGRVGSGQGVTWSAAFPSEAASLRTIRLPFADRAQVEKTLQFEVENQVPFDLDTMVLTHRIVQVSDGGSEVLAAMAPKGAVARLLSELGELKADPKLLILDLDLAAHHADQGVQAVIDLGHVRTLVSLCRDGHLVAGRALDRGGRELTAALAAAAGLDFEHAEALKHRVGLGGDGAALVEPDWDEVTATGPTLDGADAWEDGPTAQLPEPPPLDPGAVGSASATLRAALVPLLADLRATLIGLEDAHKVEVGEVLLCGGGAALHGLKELLEEALGVPVRHTRPSDEAAAGRGHPGRWGLAHAAAWKAAGTKARLLDLRVDAFAFRGDLALIGRAIQVGLLAAIALIAVGGAWFGVRVAQLNGQITDAEAEIASAVRAAVPTVSEKKAADPSMAVAIVQEASLAAAARAEALEGILSEEPPTLALWRDISESVPPPSAARVEVREMQVTPGAVTLKAETDGFEAAAKIEAALQKSPRFKEARKSDEKKVKEMVQFTINIPLEAAAEEEG